MAQDRAHGHAAHRHEGHGGAHDHAACVERAVESAVAVKMVLSDEVAVSAATSATVRSELMASLSVDMALLSTPRPEISTLTADWRRVMRASSGARSAATSWETRDAMSSPEPTPEAWMPAMYYSVPLMS